MRIFEWFNEFDFGELPKFFLKNGLHCRRLFLCLQFVYLGLQGVRVRHRIEQSRKICTLLRSDLCSRCKFRSGTITERPDSLCPFNDKEIVHEKTSSRPALGRDFGNKVFYDRTRGVSCCPDQKTIWNFFDDGTAIGLFNRGHDCFIFDFFYHGLGVELDMLFSEGGFSVLSQRRVRRGIPR